MNNMSRIRITVGRGRGIEQKEEIYTRVKKCLKECHALRKKKKTGSVVKRRACIEYRYTVTNLCCLESKKTLVIGLSASSSLCMYSVVQAPFTKRYKHIVCAKYMKRAIDARIPRQCTVAGLYDAIVDYSSTLCN